MLVSLGDLRVKPADFEANSVRLLQLVVLYILSSCVLSTLAFLPGRFRGGAARVNCCVVNAGLVLIGPDRLRGGDLIGRSPPCCHYSLM